MSSLTYDERCARLGPDRLELRRVHCDLITCFKSTYDFNCLRSEDCSLFVASKLLVVIHSNCVYNTIELMLESISLVRVSGTAFYVVTVPAFAAELCSCDLSHYLL